MPPNAEPIRPRPRNAAKTADAILRAAQRLFATRGYTTTGVREIAAEAGVNSTLVRRYFGSKEGLLRAAVSDMLVVDAFTAGDRADLGTRVAALLHHAGAAPNPLAMMLLATADPAARLLCQELMHERIIAPLAEWLGGPDALARAARMNALWIGYMTARRILPLRPLLGEADAATLRWLGETTQAIADGGPARGGDMSASPAG